MSNSPSSYIGRFAPSPTGPLHLGSLYTALASYLDARKHRGLWLLRIDDLDTPRNVAGAADAILHTLERFGLLWDDRVCYQSHHLDTYQDVFAKLKTDWLYACHCSRKQLQNQPIYPGNCRDAGFPFDETSAWRLKTRDVQIEFGDALQGRVSQNLARQHGDFIVRRKDGIIAYQFAVVVDDALQHVDHVVRGVDLLDSTPKQIYLQQLLGYRQPHYLHLPLIVDENGTKLSKQTLAAPVDDSRPAATLFLLLQLLQQNPPSALRTAPISEQLAWAIAHWHADSLKEIRTIVPSGKVERSVAG
ncbi:MAG: tRNA glutamyl-Q(34) synthetase GluQRS [Gammaproteobacteria bacterium]